VPSLYNSTDPANVPSPRVPAREQRIKLVPAFRFCVVKKALR
jgi:hypothetical protein